MLQTALPAHPGNEQPRLREYLIEQYQQVRNFSEFICQPLATEDYVIQSMPDVSPTKWHLAHTSWFFETFLLKPNLAGYTSPDPMYNFLFNSYYNAIGERHARPQRGMLSRPTVAQVYDYRRYVNAAMEQLLEKTETATLKQLIPVLLLGLHHEQQHQELILTDIKHVLSLNPLYPVYKPQSATKTAATVAPLEWTSFAEGVYWTGYAPTGQPLEFYFDNEGPRHRQFLEAFQLANRPVTNGEFLAFLEDDGYQRPEFWLSDGWATVQASNWHAPLYWEKEGANWYVFTLHGRQPLNQAEPVSHVSFYEADAYARWAGGRLPTEFEWEVAAATLPVQGNFAENSLFHPTALLPGTESASGIQQMFGDVWEWTQSGYQPYPGYQPAAGALGEYNGKFMCNQLVLRGGSCVTSLSHIRPTYRNFFPPSARWQFSGFRLAR